ncbi:MAG: hypothetical protein ACLFNT_11855 [Spirochaetales bacterium]
MGAKKLCKWSTKRIRKKTDEFENLIREPQFYCGSCGRAAADRKNLCKPRGLD